MKCVGCGKEVDKLAAKGLCGSCYYQERKRTVKTVCAGCGQKKAIHSKGLCGACYIRLQRYGSTAPRDRPKKGEHLCLQCNRDPIHAKGLCKVCYGKKHRKRVQQGKCKQCGDEGKLVARQLCEKCYRKYVESRKKDVCIGCDELKPIKGMGMCRKCYQRFLRHDDPTKGRVKKGDEPCSHCGARPVHAKHLCANCYARYIAKGDPERIKILKIDECEICGKKKRIRAKGLCGTCYAAECRAAKLGLPENAYELMLEAQNGVCAICGEPEHTKSGYKKGVIKKLAIDHDHETGVVRGLLCQMCNQGLGSFSDSKRRLTKAIDYLKQHA